MAEFAKEAAESLPALLAVLAAAFLLGFAAGRFLQRPKKEQVEQVKAWLLWAVASAERELESTPGRLKLRWVYDLFVQRFPNVAKAVPFAVFSDWVDEALKEAEEMLSEEGTENAADAIKEGKGADTA